MWRSDLTLFPTPVVRWALRPTAASHCVLDCIYVVFTSWQCLRLTLALSHSALVKQNAPKGEGHRAPPSRRKKLEGMLRRERAKECYQLGLQLNAPSPRAFSELDDTERRRLKKKAISVSKHGGDKRDLLQVSCYLPTYLPTLHTQRS